MGEYARRWLRLAGLGAGLGVVAASGALVVTGRLDRVTLLNPLLADLVELVAVVVLACSWLSRRRGWLTRGVPAVLVAAAVITGLVAAALRLSGTITDAYPVTFGLWAGLLIAALIALPVRLRRSGAWTRVLAGAAVPLTLAGGLLLIDDEYGAWPTVGDLLSHTHVVGASTLRLPRDALKSGGVLVALDPPARTSHFIHRPGSVYLPPAYFSPARPRLPVLVMLAGTPSTTMQWPTAGRAVATANAYAARHGGRAPVMVFVDQNGSNTGDTECVDGPRGNAETYLTADVKNFVVHTLRVQSSPSHWAVVGFSEGGTCAYDLTLGHPTVFRHFVDLAGDNRPTLGTPRRTLTGLYGGSVAAMERHDPGRLLAGHRYRGVTGWFAAGTRDRRHIAAAHKMANQATRAGLTVHQFVGVGGHNWQFASSAFAHVFAALCADLGLRASPPPQAHG